MEQDRASSMPVRGYQWKQHIAKQPLSAADAMTAAAKAMSDTLKTALVLVEHANNQSQNTLERRLPRYRREYDMLSDIH
jgi:hypothetical protein